MMSFICGAVLGGVVGWAGVTRYYPNFDGWVRD
jgi:hypothetical protein